MTGRTHFIYRVFDEFGQLLYIGCTKDPSRRWAQHKAEAGPSTWVQYAHDFKMVGPYTKADAFSREAAAIEAEKPAFNALSAHRRSQGANYRRKEALLRTLRVRRPELFDCQWDSPEFAEFHIQHERIQKLANALVPVIGAKERHAAYLETRQLRLVASA